jgi:hypothetical protein
MFGFLQNEAKIEHLTNGICRGYDENWISRRHSLGRVIWSSNLTLKIYEEKRQEKQERSFENEHEEVSREGVGELDSKSMEEHQVIWVCQNSLFRRLLRVIRFKHLIALFILWLEMLLYNIILIAWKDLNVSL